MDTSVLKAVPLFKDIEAEDLEALGQLMSETSLKRGDSLFREGDEGDRLYIVTDGKVKLSHASDDGRENLIAVLGPGEIIGELSLFDLGARSSTVSAIAPTRLISLSHKDMMSFINQHPAMAITMLRELARRLRNTNEQMADLVFSDVPGRVAKALIDLANRFGERTPEGIYVAHDLTQEELAHLVGASRETVNKSLADFVSRGWIRLEGRAVLLIELGRLQRRAH
ncbi:MAG: Crp/Fnr family transcriptional regulator [Actinomycetaceae bacterium]|nr:Crp/Fnr family transcriptional regulator [Actinomycetaceae bacterium]